MFQYDVGGVPFRGSGGEIKPKEMVTFQPLTTCLFCVCVTRGVTSG